MRPPARWSRICGARPRPRRWLWLAALLVLAGCADTAPPAYMAPQGDGATARAGSVVVTDAAIAFAGSVDDPVVYRAGASADLVGTVVNAGDAPDRLVAVRSPVAADATVTGDPAMAVGAALAIGPQPAAALPGVAPVRVRLRGLRTDIRSGLTYPVEMEFAAAGTVTLALPVARPAAPRSGCPLPPNGRVPEVLSAPGGAPVPSTTPPPPCSSLLG